VVAASCAVPGIWLSVTIGDLRYIDGGVRSATKIDLAAGYPLLLLLAPLADLSLHSRVAELTQNGSRVK
jgi:NTE family protein